MVNNDNFEENEFSEEFLKQNGLGSYSNKEEYYEINEFYELDEIENRNSSNKSEKENNSYTVSSESVSDDIWYSDEGSNNTSNLSSSNNEDEIIYLSDEEEEETFGGDPTSMYTRAYQGTASLKTNGNSVYFSVGSRFDKIDAVRVRRGKCNVSVNSAKTVSIFRKGNFKGECKIYIWGHKSKDKKKGTKYVKLFVHFK